MKKLFIAFMFISTFSFAQVDEAKTGAWYMLFYNHDFKNSQFGIQGDFQFRNWNLLGDLEQHLWRSGFTYHPKNANIKFTLGYAHIITGTPGDSDETSSENRIYQEALFPTKLGRFHLTHRFRYEQRFVENQDFRTRYRYNLFINVPFNKKDLSKDAVYLTLYNELFINGETEIGDNREVEFFDRNRTYLGLGYVLSSKTRLQLGWMNQKTNTWGKGQMQVSAHVNF